MTWIRRQLEVLLGPLSIHIHVIVSVIDVGALVVSASATVGVDIVVVLRREEAFRPRLPRLLDS